MTFGESYGPAMNIYERKEARVYFAQLVAELMRSKPTMPRSEAEAITKQNLGYFAAYYDNETRRRVELLFDCYHPTFGPIAHKGPPTPEEAFEMGRKLGEKINAENQSRMVERNGTNPQTDRTDENVAADR